MRHDTAENTMSPRTVKERGQETVPDIFAVPILVDLGVFSEQGPESGEAIVQKRDNFRAGIRKEKTETLMNQNRKRSLSKSSLRQAMRNMQESKKMISLSKIHYYIFYFDNVIFNILF